MSESGTDAATDATIASQPGAVRERGAFEEIARKLRLDEAREISLDATIRRGALSASLPPETRQGEAGRHASATLPRLDVAATEGGTSELELVRALGQGGMGVVWLARQRSLGRDVAVKRLRQETATASAASALLVEARATGALEHPSIVPVHALGIDADGSPLLVMKRIEGESLGALLLDPEHGAWLELENRHGDRLAALVEILMRVADALHFAHARGLVHRDVKPDNVMVGSFGEVYLVDWGVALRPLALDDDELANIGIVGTPAFMAPEMVRGDARAIDARTDVYLLGATLHAMLTSTPRHRGATLPQVLLAALISEPVAYGSDVHGELGALANRATRAEPADRPASALAFRQALAEVLRHRGSARLAEEAKRRLDALAEPGPATLATAESTRALAECRFGFTQALREWSGNEAAREGLGATLRWMIEAELHRRSPDAAEALVRELCAVPGIAKDDDALTARIAALRAELASARRLEDAARREAHERDPRLAARQRVWLAIGIIIVTIVLVALGWRSEIANGGARPMSEVLVYDAALLSFVVLSTFALRGRLLANRLGRQIAIIPGLVLIAGTMSDVFMAMRGATTHDAAPFSMLAMAAVLAGGAVGVYARLAWSAAAFVTGAIVCAVWPALSIPAIGGAAIAATAVVLGEALRHTGASDAPK